MIDFDLFSDVYDRIRKTWFGSWQWNASTYGPRDLNTEHKHYFVEFVEMKKGTSIKHGRCVIIYNNGNIIDCFFKENKRHGPTLNIYSNDTYWIQQWENGKYVSRKWFRADGTPT